MFSHVTPIYRHLWTLHVQAQHLVFKFVRVIGHSHGGDWPHATVRGSNGSTDPGQSYFDQRDIFTLPTYLPTYPSHRAVSAGSLRRIMWLGCPIDPMVSTPRLLREG